MWTYKPLWASLFLISLILLLCYSPLHLLFDHDFLAAWLEAMGYRAVIAFLLVYIIATVIGVPGTVLTLAGGIVFGLGWGSLWSVIGATGGAIGAFWVARYLLHDLTMRWFGQHRLLCWLNRAISGNPYWVVLSVRFAPISPFNLVNYLFGLTTIRVGPYAIGTLFGIAPGTILYTWLGVTGDAALHGEDPWPFILALALLGGLSVLPLLRRWRGRHVSPRKFG